VSETATGPLTRPIPRPDAVTQGFWEAAARGTLAIQRCADCGAFQHPPRPLCRACRSERVAFQPVSGEGRLWSWTVTHRSVLRGLEAALPYTCLIVELKEQAGLLVVSDLIGREQLQGRLKLGMRMRAVFPPPIGEDFVLPQFEPDAAGRGDAA
jgi:uncharacterized OB-fold protein